MIFEIMYIHFNTSKIVTAKNMAHYILSNGFLWDKEKQTTIDNESNQESSKIRHGNNNVYITHVQKSSELESDKTETTETNYFLICVDAPYEFLTEPNGLNNNLDFRAGLLCHLEKDISTTTKTSKIYILKDEASSKIAEELYPLINAVENELRRFLQKYFLFRQGPKALDNVTKKDGSEEQKENKKANSSRHKDMYTENMGNNLSKDLFLLDFRALGEILYNYSYGHSTTQDLKNKIKAIDVGSENLKELIIGLQKETESNIDKYFPELKERKFQDNWQYLTEIRIRVAHNLFFNKRDIDKTNESKGIVSDMICNSESGLPKSFTSEEGNGNFELSEDKLIDQDDINTVLSLIKDRYTEISLKRHGYIGLSHFAKVVVPEALQTYDLAYSFDIINFLADKGEIEIYDFYDDSTYGTVKAIKPSNFKELIIA